MRQSQERHQPFWHATSMNRWIELWRTWEQMKHLHALHVAFACWQHLIGRLECVVENTLGAGHQNLAGLHDICQRLDGPCHKWRGDDLRSRAARLERLPRHAPSEHCIACASEPAEHSMPCYSHPVRPARCACMLEMQPRVAKPTTSMISAARTTCAMSPEARNASGRVTPCGTNRLL